LEGCSSDPKRADPAHLIERQAGDMRELFEQGFAVKAAGSSLRFVIAAPRRLVRADASKLIGDACLLKETEERIAILSDPNFDCLATNTTPDC